MSLKKYQSKRNFNRTQEPKGTVKGKHHTLLYVIQKHNASHLHYDLRLEMNGVLKSWAIPKGPHLNPKIKRLAVEVEDHPIEYGSFEGIIPKGEYGAGTVIIWDKGEWIPDGDPNKAYRKGDLTFTIKGKKLKGKWKLIRIKTNQGGLETSTSSRKKHWLFFKINDSEAMIDSEITEEKPFSVITQKGKKNRDREMNINSGANRDIDTDTDTDSDIDAVAKIKTDIKTHIDIRMDARKMKMPTQLKPELCFLTKKPPLGSDWIHEIKFDGYRIIAFIDKEKSKSVRLISRNGKDWTQKFPQIAKDLMKLPIEKAILDGELVAIDKKGISHFQFLQNSLQGDSQHPLRYYAFDMLYYNGYNLKNITLLERKKLLKNILEGRKNNGNNKHVESSIFFSEHIQGKGDLVYKKACASHLEGIVSKACNSKYESKRSKSWLKSKCIKRQEFIIGGFTKPKGKRLGFGSLLIGYYNNKHELIYCGHVGTGFNDKTLHTLYEQLKEIVQHKNPFDNPIEKSIQKNVIWVKPRLVAELEFTEWTQDNILRHPSFIGLRLDKPAKEVIPEKSIKSLTEKILKAKIQSKLSKTQKQTKVSKQTKEDVSLNQKSRITDDQIEIAGVELSHPDNLIAVSKFIKKQDLAEYYRKINEWIMPHLKDRPLSLLRCPANIKKKSKSPCFFNKHYSNAFPKGIIPISIHEKIRNNSNEKKEIQDKQDYLMIQNLAGLIGLVQINALEIHPWSSRKTSLEKPDRVIFDLDPDPKVSWDVVIAGAKSVNLELKKLDLTAYLKTTGGKGLHIVLPILPQYTWEKVKSFAEAFSRYMAQKYPNQFTATVTKTKRKGKIYLDYLRNTRGATAVAAYSTRASEGCPISTPITWKELAKIRSSQQFNLANILTRINQLKTDPWQGFFQSKQKLPKF